MDRLGIYIDNIERILLKQLSGRVGELVETYLQNKDLTEEGLRQKVCGDKDEQYFYNLKARTFKMLQALTIVSVKKGTSSLKKKQDQCQKQYLIGTKFIGIGERKEGIHLIKQAYRIAVEYEFVDYAADASRILYHHHILYTRNAKLAASYEKEATKYLEANFREREAELQMCKITNGLNRPRDFEAAKEMVSQLAIKAEDSGKCRAYKWASMVLFEFHLSNYEAVIEHCTVALDFIKGRKSVYSSLHQFFWSRLGLAQLVTGKYEAAETSFSAARKLAYPKSVNEYIVGFYQTINALHAGQYQKAYEIYQQYQRCKYEMLREPFAMIQAYFCFLAHLGHLQLAAKFRLGKYLNETFKSQNDKEGGNITVLIAELLVHLARDRGRFIDRVEAIKTYSYRYLKSRDTMRAKRFIKILCLLPKANFDPTHLSKIAKRPVQYLTTQPLHIGENVFIEIIPFEDLLAMILRHLAGEGKG